MADLGSEATRHFSSRGSPSERATSRGFSLKKGTVPSITSRTVVILKVVRGKIMQYIKLNV